MQTYYLDREKGRNKVGQSTTVALMWLNGVLMLLEMSLHGLMLGGLIICAFCRRLFDDIDYLKKQLSRG
ncbi:hypothetical protein A6770_32305 [Nostoc minutum NIES-26]|uniref:Uncharacterized protein n=1 Tax=Nostoc minutum NIES-26 TaxID=1844469 RepID=A0A367Q4K3_9NOSO|nr:hypothetical protein A6770_32305 [Nostoc minutum NIES-26]